MLRTLVVHGPRLAIGGSLESPVRVFCPKEYREAHLPTFPFMVVDMRRVLSFRSTPRQARRPPDRYADRYVQDAPGGNQGKPRGPLKTLRRAKRRRNDSGGEGERPRGGPPRKWPLVWRRMTRFRSWACVPPKGRARIRAPPPGAHSQAHTGRRQFGHE